MKKYRVLIWGTGNWCSRLLKELPANCIIEAFIETSPLIDEYMGKYVISEKEFREYYEMSDFTIIAVEKSEEIKDEVYNILHSWKNIFFCSNKAEKLYCYSIDAWGSYDIKDLFDEKFINTRMTSYTSGYTICNCNGVSFVVNSQYKMMINALAAGINFQQDDIELFFELSNKYYGISNDSTGLFLDIGANIGTTSIWVKKVVNPNLDIVAFEPIKENCKQFRCNFILNDIDEDEYTLINAALSNSNSIAECMLSEDNHGDNRVVINGNQDQSKSIEKIVTLKLDDWVKKSRINIDQIKYIWMDVQAHEGFVLSGGIETLSKKHIPIFMEFWPIELKKNKSLEMLVEQLKKCYKQFICIQWYKQGDRTEYKIEELIKIAELHPNQSFDIFLF